MHVRWRRPKSNRTTSNQHLRSDPNNTEALADLSSILLLRGDQKVGLLTQLQALQIKQLFTIQTRGDFRLLIIKTPGDFMANTPVEFMIRTSDISADELYIAPNLPYPVLVDYDLVFIAISKAEVNKPALEVAHTLLKQWRLPYVNNPGEIPFLCHMAISENWLVHYLNAGMTFDEEKRFEENRAMIFFDAGLAERHKEAFHHLTEIIDLDYFGIDCAETPDRQLLIFELANAMIVHHMDPINMFPYKHPAMEKVFKAFHQMLRDKVSS